MFHFLLLKRYATANNPAIADIASYAGIGVGVCDGVIGGGVGVCSFGVGEGVVRPPTKNKKRDKLHISPIFFNLLFMVA